MADYKDRLEARNRLIQEYKDLASKAKNTEEESLYISREKELVEQNINQLRREHYKLVENGEEVNEEILKNIKEQEKELTKLTRRQRTVNDEAKKELKTRDLILKSVKSMNGALKSSWEYLMNADKAIKSTNLSLGLSGSKADMMRTSFERSAAHVSRLGGSLD
ncbi:MAG: hypothetical protein ACOC2W_00940, partial [bacterium]